MVNRVAYYYEGFCPRKGELLRLPRTDDVEQIACALMQQMEQDDRFSGEGKMYGVLLAETASGEPHILKAFSGLLNGQGNIEGWVSPILGRSRVALEEAQTLAALEAIKQDLMTLGQMPSRQQCQALAQQFEMQLAQLSLIHQSRKQARHHQRLNILSTLEETQLADAIEQLNEQSRQDGRERRWLKQARDEALQPLKLIVEQADARIRLLKLRRKALSRRLQAQMHNAYALTNFAGESWSISQFSEGGMPTGTGDCCAPKLLHYAATYHLKPVAMAEFWWGSVGGDKIPGKFYPACTDRCQPILGFLLSGLPEPLAIADRDLSIIFEDDWLIAVDKPAGLLSVPGRYADRQDSVLRRVRQSFPHALTIHRLDQDTSGILLAAKDIETCRYLSRQFQERRVSKVYEAVLAGVLLADQGIINLPLGADLANRPYQKVDHQQGKPSQTQFRVISRTETTRVEFIPLTGRTHQIRVHAAVGLGIPIMGDRLYQSQHQSQRLHLHAKELRFQHLQLGQEVHLQTKVPF